MFDLARDESMGEWVARFFEGSASNVLGAVCHGPAALLPIRLANGKMLLKDHSVTAFSDAEERAVGLSDSMPFSLEQELQRTGAEYKALDNWTSHVVVSGRLVTGQNPASATDVGKAMVKLAKK